MMMRVTRRLHSDIGEWNEELQSIRENDPQTTDFDVGDDSYIQNMSDDALEQLGRDISNNTHLTYVELSNGALNDHNMTCLFRGLTRSSSITNMLLYENQLSVAGTSMVPFLQNANNLKSLDLDDNNLQSEGFNLLFRALSDSPIERLTCSNCGIESIEIDIEHAPRHLTSLNLENNIINADGCREIAKLLQETDSTTLTDLSTLESLYLQHNKISDDGIETLVNALHRNTTLRELFLKGNTDMSKKGKIMLLKLVINISSIEATLQSNHTLREIKFTDYNDRSDIIQQLIDRAVAITNYSPYPEDAGRQKVRKIQMNGTKREQLADLQGVTNSVYSEIDSLYMPEVLALINRYHGGKELFSALQSTVTGLLSRVDMKLCIQEQMARNKARIEQQVTLHEEGISGHRDQIAHHEARIKDMISEHESMMDEYGVKMEELNARLAAMEETDEKVDENTRTQSSKRRRVD